MTQQIEYHCPDCGSITPIVPGMEVCLGCKKPLLVIAVSRPCDCEKCVAIRERLKVIRERKAVLAPLREETK